MDKLFANSEDPDQTPHFAASDLGLHCLPNTLLGVCRLQWVKESSVKPCECSDVFLCLYTCDSSLAYYQIINQHVAKKQVP